MGALDNYQKFRATGQFQPKDRRPSIMSKPISDPVPRDQEEPGLEAVSPEDWIPSPKTIMSGLAALACLS